MTSSSSDSIRYKDVYGFEATFSDAKYEKSFASQRRRRREKWHDEFFAKSGSDRPGRFSPELKELCRKGIPDESRSKIWSYCLGADLKLKKNPGLYKQLLERAPSELPRTVRELIEVDLERTFPDHPRFYRTEIDDEIKRNRSKERAEDDERERLELEKFNKQFETNNSTENKASNIDDSFLEKDGGVASVPGEASPISPPKNNVQDPPPMFAPGATESNSPLPLKESKTSPENENNNEETNVEIVENIKRDVSEVVINEGTLPEIDGQKFNVHRNTASSSSSAVPANNSYENPDSKPFSNKQQSAKQIGVRK